MIESNNIRHYINGEDFGEPRNWQGLKIKMDWINKQESIDLSITDLEFVLKASTHLQQRALNGLDGGVGIFEGEPYQITIGNASNPKYTFNGYLDFTDSTTFLGSEEFICSLKKVESSDWLNEVADSFGFAYLEDQGIITDSDYVKVPYIINYIPDGMQLIVLSMSLFMMTKELIQNTSDVADAIGVITNASTPVVGASVGVGAGVVTAWDIGDYIYASLKVIARIAYLVAIVIAIKKLIEEIFEQLFPAKRYHLGMTFRTILEKGCQHLGLTFSSNIEELDWVHIPRKDRKGGEDGEKGFPLTDGPLGTMGDAIRVLKKMFNADYRIQEGVFYFNRKDDFDVLSTFVIPSFFNDQERLLDRFKFNTDEIISNYHIHWAYDTQDQNTLDFQDGRVFQAITTPITTINSNMVNISNIAEIDIPFSLGRTKLELTTLEEVAKGLGQFVDSLTGVFGGGTSFASQIKNRVGALHLSSHFLTVGKVVKMNGSNLTNDQRGDLAAINLWEKFHFINSFAEINGVHNQYFRFEDVKVPMSLENFDKLLETDKVTDSDGNEAEIEYFEYEPQSGTATLNVRIKKKFTNNLKIEYVQ